MVPDQIVPVLSRMRTDAECSMAFSDAVHGRVIYADQQDRWYVANNNVFEPVTSARVQGIARDFVMGAASRADISDFASAKSLLSQSRINGTVALSRSNLTRNPVEFDSDDFVVGCHGGVLDL